MLSDLHELAVWTRFECSFVLVCLVGQLVIPVDHGDIVLEKGTYDNLCSGAPQPNATLSAGNHTLPCLLTMCPVLGAFILFYWQHITILL